MLRLSFSYRLGTFEKSGSWPIAGVEAVSTKPITNLPKSFIAVPAMLIGKGWEFALKAAS